ncbi:S1 family peptidase [Streptomyces sp. SID8352]|uniref:S1 family peptidase n=1 Tax=Streptomyces sp. SID8352 TaxID=2690338 RepID=UPI001368EC49|nr:S1 family peptidase [Streptomyces sp. SID8352]MYU20591.1 trypsin-like serine protease [Streptomyces sp. SID8352]
MVGRTGAGPRRAALAALGALLVTALPPAASAASPPAPRAPSGVPRTAGADRPPPGVLAAVERDLRLTPDQATARLANEAEAGVRAGRLREALGERFGGAWLSGATSAELTVATTDAADTAAIEAEGARARIVPRGLGPLRAVRARLDAAALRLDTARTPVWSVDVRTNRVVVRAADTAAAEAFAEAAGVDPAELGVELSAERPRLLKDLVGGDPYVIDGRARCSVGFSVTRGSEPGFATAGHCGAPGASTTGYDGTAQGTFRASVFPGADMAWVGVNADWTATPGVRDGNGGTVEVTGSAEALVGASVCRSGSTTGWHCGTVEHQDVSVRYAEGTVNGLTGTTVCAEPGDSGGPFVSGTQAQGTTSGGSGDCVRGGTTYFQPVNPLLDAFGLTLTTTGTGTAALTGAAGDTTGTGTGPAAGPMTAEAIAGRRGAPWEDAPREGRD